MDCPKCREPTRVLETDGLRASLCESCLGLWVPGDMVERFVLDKRFRERAQRDFSDNPIRATRLTCRPCRTDLGRIELAGIEVEYCVGCNGMFFDHGEIERLVGEARRVDFLFGEHFAEPIGRILFALGGTAHHGHLANFYLGPSPEG